jgi:hypothetical protein
MSAATNVGAAGAAAPRIVAPGVQLEPTRKKIFQRSFVTKTYGRDSIHNDEYTRKNGYPGALISAYVLSGMVSELLVNFFGESWVTTGKYHLKFIGKGLQQGNVVQCGGVVTAVEDCGGGDRRVCFDVWIEKDGSRPVIGTASGILSGASTRALAPRTGDRLD